MMTPVICALQLLIRLGISPFGTRLRYVSRELIVNLRATPSTASDDRTFITSESTFKNVF